MGARWKLLGPLEAMNGVLMLGMSAAALMAILQEVIKLQRGVRLSPSAPGRETGKTRQAP
jgi:hypothetical protein